MDLKKEIAKIRVAAIKQSAKEITFFIGGEDESEDYVIVDGVKMDYDEFSERFPTSKPTEFEIEVGDWRE